ncbi:MAG: hypothetical protein CMJ59_19550 [Planctomycetaceae bacterium]|nr:hypothetical protein [Planctomycetaceae bacterium]
MGKVAAHSGNELWLYDAVFDCTHLGGQEGDHSSQRHLGTITRATCGSMVSSRPTPATQRDGGWPRNHGHQAVGFHRPVWVQFSMRDCTLYAFQFADPMSDR